MFTSAHKGRRSDLHRMHIAMHSNKKHRCILTCCTQKEGGATCKLFRKVVGVSQDVLPIKTSRPSLALSLWATLISLRVNPPTTKATMRFPCNMHVCVTLVEFCSKQQTLRVTPPTTKATMRFPCNTRVSPSSSIIANSKRSRSHLPLQWLQYGSPATCISPPCRLRFEWCHRANSVCVAARKL